VTISLVQPPGNPRVVGTFTFPTNQEPIQFFAYDGELGPYWLLATEICHAVGEARTNNITRYLPVSTRRLIDRDRASKVSTPGLTRGNPQVLLISEGGMYRLLMRSRRPEAAVFQAWVADEVLPTIRRTGGYSLNSKAVEVPQDYVAALRAHADAVERQQTLEREAHVLKASLQAHDELKAAVTRIMGAGDTLTVGEAAQALCRDPRIHTGERRLFNVMARERWIYRRGGTGAWRPYQECVQRGFLEGAVTEFQTPDGETHFKVQIRVTIRGLLTLWQLLGGTGDMPDEVLALPAA